MPHTNRKKKDLNSRPQGGDHRKKFSHSKREFLDDDDGWTHVANKGWKSAAKGGQLPSGGLNMSADMTLEEMIREHSRYQTQWRSSEACVQLQKLILEGGKAGKKVVRNIICLGLGSLQALSLEWRQTSHVQLAALKTIRETSNLTCQIIMQDPRFTDLDRSFLTTMDCEVVDDPNAFARIDENSLVYAIHCPFHIYPKIREKGFPALLISNDFRLLVFDEPNVFVDTEGEPANIPPHELVDSDKNDAKIGSKYYENTLSLIDDCEETPFPQLKWDFSDTLMYWRRSSQTNDG